MVSQAVDVHPIKRTNWARSPPILCRKVTTFSDQHVMRHGTSSKSRNLYRLFIYFFSINRLHALSMHGTAIGAYTKSSCIQKTLSFSKDSALLFFVRKETVMFTFYRSSPLSFASCLQKCFHIHFCAHVLLSTIFSTQKFACSNLQHDLLVLHHLPPFVQSALRLARSPLSSLSSYLPVVTISKPLLDLPESFSLKDIFLCYNTLSISFYFHSLAFLL